MGRHTALALSLPDTAQQDTRWFSGTACVWYGPRGAEVFVGGTLIGTFEPTDVGVRNVLLVGLANEPRIKKGKLAWAFGVSSEQLRRILRLVETEGLDAIPRRPRGGSETKVTPALRERLFAAFDGGQSAYEAHKGLRGKRSSPTLSYRTVCRVRESWEAERATKAMAISALEAAQQQVALPLPPAAVTKECEAAGENTCDEQSSAQQNSVCAQQGNDEQSYDEQGSDEPQSSVEQQRTSTNGKGMLAEDAGAEETISDETVQGAPVRGGRFVQHLGGWLLLAAVHAMGLHEAVQQRWTGGKAWRERFRLAVDAVVLALGLGQRCVEGVRRLATSSGALLLRADHMPSESWVRIVLKKYISKASAFWVHLTMMGVYLERARAEGQGAVVFYVDNHMRPYTGKHTVRKGWRMQDKRVKPGATDYYVHDEDGRPVFRWNAPSNDSLTQWLSPVMAILRASLGKEQRLLVAFDRAGAFPAQMAELRDGGFEFVTYERRPFPLLGPSVFTQTVTVDEEVIGVHESRLKNLGQGRGRVRRIALKMPDGNQVNLLAVSKEPAKRLIEVMLGRWVQENGFKHGNERWGINQLDRRKVEHYAPETIIPNPARRRLDNALRIARQREGEARRKLAHLTRSKDEARRAKLKQVLAEAVAEQKQLLAQRPQVPDHVRLDESQLAGELVYHHGDYKTLMDTIRIACANAESELASLLAPHLLKPAEAKKTLANLLAAPGQIRVNRKSITVTLSPAGTATEKKAFRVLLRTVNRWKLTLPADPNRRPLRFQSQL